MCFFRKIKKMTDKYRFDIAILDEMVYTVRNKLL